MERSPIDVVTGLRNTRRSMGDGTLGGRSRIATPYREGDARRVAASRVVPPSAVTAGGRFVRFAVEPGVAVDTLTFGDPLQAAGWDHTPGPVLVIPAGPAYYDLRARLVVNHRGNVRVWVTVNGNRIWPADPDLDSVWLGGDGVPLFLDAATGPVSPGDEVEVRCDPPIEIVKGRASMQLVDRQAGQVQERPAPLPDVTTAALEGSGSAIKVPEATVPGDRLVAFVFWFYSLNQDQGVTPQGWTEIGDHLGGGGLGRYRVRVYTKLAEPGDADSDVRFLSGSVLRGRATMARMAGGPAVVDVGCEARFHSQERVLTLPTESSGRAVMFGCSISDRSELPWPELLSPQEASLLIEGSTLGGGTNVMRDIHRAWVHDGPRTQVQVDGGTSLNTVRHCAAFVVVS